MPRLIHCVYCGHEVELPHHAWVCSGCARYLNDQEKGLAAHVTRVVDKCPRRGGLDHCKAIGGYCHVLLKSTRQRACNRPEKTVAAGTWKSVVLREGLNYYLPGVRGPRVHRLSP